VALSGSAAWRARRGCESVDYDVNVVHRPYALHQSGVAHVTCFSNAGRGMLGAELVPGSVARRPLEHLRRLPIIPDETPLNLETLRLAAFHFQEAWARAAAARGDARTSRAGGMVLGAHLLHVVALPYGAVRAHKLGDCRAPACAAALHGACCHAKLRSVGPWQRGQSFAMPAQLTECGSARGGRGTGAYA
jgi:hypothetical protein